METSLWSEKFNKGLLIIFGWLFFAVFFMMTIACLLKNQIFKSKQANKAKKQKVGSKLIPPIVTMFDHGMFIIIPFLAGFRNTLVFIIPITAHHCFRVCLVIIYRKQMTRYILLKEICNKAIWLIFHSMFIVLYAVEKKSHFLQHAALRDYVKYINYSILILMFLGIVL